LLKVQAYGKSIWFFFKKDDKNYIMTSQLGMSGSWFLNDYMKERGNFHFAFKLNNGNWLKYSDPRMFGKIIIYEGQNFDSITKEIIKFKKWGIDPMQSSVKDIAHNLSSLKKSGKSIKEKLLEQNIIFGIGNYLASEVLFDSKINPKEKCSNLSEENFKSIAQSIKKWIILAEESGGFSFAGGYILPDGSLGNLSTKVKVYQKDGGLCPVCKNNKIVKDFMSGRATYYCPHCQK
jgi:formamidopyrimidine-DNA glycosylase